jgi:hypothetical protein
VGARRLRPTLCEDADSEIADVHAYFLARSQDRLRWALRPPRKGLERAVSLTICSAQGSLNPRPCWGHGRSISSARARLALGERLTRKYRVTEHPARDVERAEVALCGIEKAALNLSAVFSFFLGVPHEVTGAASTDRNRATAFMTVLGGWGGTRQAAAGRPKGDHGWPNCRRARALIS